MNVQNELRRIFNQEVAFLALSVDKDDCEDVISGKDREGTLG